MISIIKYPRTHHIETSRLQPGDEDLDSISMARLAGRDLVVEEKLDGANSAISFSKNGELLLQSRGHYLTGGYRERHFDLLKAWANRYNQSLFELLGSRFVMFGEWMYAKHTIFYTHLPHYFMEFDIYDKAERVFLDTNRRRAMLNAFPFIVSVKVLSEGAIQQIDDLISLMGPSHFIQANPWSILEEVSKKLGLRIDQVKAETDDTRLMEGLYVKVEEEGVVKERLKWIRPSFLTNVLESESHWLNRPIVPNQLVPGAEIF